MTFKTLAAHANTRAVAQNTPVSQAIPGRTDVIANSGGGFSFEVNDWTKLDRFLIIGTEGGTFYAGEKTLNERSLTVAKKLLQEDGNRVVDRCVEISAAGRAKNNDYALLVMAMAMTHGPDHTKRYAAASLPLVARTGTHLMHFTQFANGMRGWGKTLKYAIQNWYASKTPDQIAYQAIKYQQRDGWSQRDLLRLSHPNAGDDALRNTVYRYIVRGRDGMTQGAAVPAVIVAFEQAKTADEKTLVKLITDHRLSHEMIPNEMKNRPAVWEALYQHMGTTALIRNLNKFTAVGLIAPFSQFSKDVVARLNNVELLQKDRIHPMTVLIAQRQYAQGRGDKGSLTWNPDKSIVQGLEGAFYESFKAVTPSGKNIMLALDVSGSMVSMNRVVGAPQLWCAEAATVVAMVTARCEKNSQIFGFSDKLVDLGITANDSMEGAMKKAYSRAFGATNMSLPMQLAQQQKWDIDAFAVYTDNEVNQGYNYPSQALQNYRKQMGKPHAKLISVGMAVNNVSIADPKDRGMLDVVGFDSDAPRFISSFIADQL